MSQKQQAHTVRRPVLYMIVGALGIALALPLALASGQTKMGGLFDECYAVECSNTPAFADLQEK